MVILAPEGSGGRRRNLATIESRPCTGGLPASDSIPSTAQVVANNSALPVSFARITLAARLSMDARIPAVSSASDEPEGCWLGDWHAAARIPRNAVVRSVRCLVTTIPIEINVLTESSPNVRDVWGKGIGLGSMK